MNTHIGGAVVLFARMSAIPRRDHRHLTMRAPDVATTPEGRIAMRYACLILGALLGCWSALALAADTAAPGVTVDLTGIASSVVAGVFSILGIVIPLTITRYMRDQAAASTLSAAVKNSLGAMQRAASGVVLDKRPQVTIPGVPPALVSGVQYVLDHAGDEATRLGISDIAIASKINAQLGLANIQTNIAKAAVTAPGAASADPPGGVTLLRGSPA